MAWLFEIVDFMMAKVSNVQMNNGLTMPGFGLGTFEVKNIFKIALSNFKNDKMDNVQGKQY